MRLSIASLPAACAGLILATQVVGAQAAEVRLLSSNALKSAVQEVKPQFESSTEHRIAGTFAAAATLKAQIEKGENFDVAILTAPLVDDLIRQGRLAAGSRALLARSAAGVAIHRGAPKPDISTVEAFKAALRNAQSIGYVEQGQTGIYLKELLARLGLADELKSRLKAVSTGAGEAVAKGEVELGLTQISEILPYPQAELAGPFPAEIQMYTDFAAAISTAALQAEAAKALIKFMTGPAALPVYKAKGLDPAR
ncbi:MAG TPA: substrate-binding domain-containing protein [Xanthobacteraceae bacterium]|jgi:molybdate transport system substrate-binding protein